VDISGAADTVTRSVGLDLPDQITDIGGQTFDVTVTLRASASSRNFAAGVVVVGADPKRTYSLGVDRVVVTLGGGDQALNAVDAASFAASINVAGLDAGSHDVDVRVVAPPGLKVVAVSPARITVFVSPLATPPPSPSPTPSPSPEPSASASAAALETSPSPSGSP
jgi:YbbR domain-containing protein